MESFKYGSYNQKEYRKDEKITPTDIQKHLKIGRIKTYQLIQLSSFPKIKIGNTYRIPKEKYLKWISDNIRKTIFL